jgi:hypothetical protein
MNTFKQHALTSLALLVIALSPVGATWAQQVTVTAADPASALQGTLSLDVAISGSGFDSTAQVEFLATGTTDPGGITVRKVVAKGSRKLVATIDIADTALVDKFDIEVTLTSGRKGKGTTLFTVQAKTTGSVDPCSTPGLDFPAFTYSKNTGSTRYLYMADSTGVCSRLIMPLRWGAAAPLVYPLPGTTNVGRILFPYDNGTLAWADFTVDRSDNTIALGPSTPLPAFTNWGLSIFSADGASVYYATSPASPEEFPAIHRLLIDGPQYPQPPEEIYRSLEAGSVFGELSVSEDGTKLVAEEVHRPLPYQSFPTHHRVLLIPLPCSDNTTCATVLAENAAYMYPSLNSAGTTVAYSDYQAGSNNCSLLRFVDTTTGTPLFAGTQPRYGAAKSWFDDQLLVESRKPPDRKNYCRPTDSVSLMDPATGAETALLSGSQPHAR